MKLADVRCGQIVTVKCLQKRGEVKKIALCAQIQLADGGSQIWLLPKELTLVADNLAALKGGVGKQFAEGLGTTSDVTREPLTGPSTIKMVQSPKAKK